VLTTDAHPAPTADTLGRLAAILADAARERQQATLNKSAVVGNLDGTATTAADNDKQRGATHHDPA